MLWDPDRILTCNPTNQTCNKHITKFARVVIYVLASKTLKRIENACLLAGNLCNIYIDVSKN